MHVLLLALQQPAAELFFNFDQLLLLRRGGETVYFGSIRDRAKPLVKYMEDMSRAVLPLRTNPANWMLDVLSAFPSDTCCCGKRRSRLLISPFCVCAPTHRADKNAPGCRKDIDYADAYKASSLCSVVTKEVEEMITASKSIPQPDPSEWRITLSPFQKFKVVFGREWPASMVHGPCGLHGSARAGTDVVACPCVCCVHTGTARDYWRDLYYNVARFVAVVALGVFLGLVFYNVSPTCSIALAAAVLCARLCVSCAPAAAVLFPRWHPVPHRLSVHGWPFHWYHLHQHVHWPRVQRACCVLP